MPFLNYTYPPFVAFTVIKSAEVNAKYEDIRTLLNVTKLDDDNIQNAGITRATKLKTGSANALIVNNGSGAMSELTAGAAGTIIASQGAGLPLIFISNPLTTVFPFVVGSAADVTAGVAQYSSIVTAENAMTNGDTMLILKTYVGVEALATSKKIRIVGQGPTTRIDGSVSVSGVDFEMHDLRVTGAITLSSGAHRAIITDVKQPDASAINVDSLVEGEYIRITKEA